MKNILITGGAGYIGTNIAVKLLLKNYNVIVVDNFSNSKPTYINFLIQKYQKQLRLFQLDIFDAEFENILSTQKIDCIIHLAGKKYVAESFIIPSEYQKQNVLMTKRILDLLSKYNINQLVFASSITVYGNPQNIPASEIENLNPLSPYAKNKMDCEKLIFERTNQNNFCATILRLSNPVGANTKFMLGDDAKNEKYQSIVPYIVSKIINEQELTFNGNNHSTRDGTTIRDYIHIEDVANAFVSAVESRKSGFNVYNIGYGGQGSSVLEILKCAEKLINKKAKYSFGAKRNGDISIFIANTNKAQKEINFETKFNLDDIIKSQIIFTKNKK